MKGLIVGAVAGALAAMYWHEDLMRMRGKTGGASPGSLRERLADTLESVEASVGEGLDRTRTTACATLRRWSRTIRGTQEDRPSVTPERSESL